VMTGTTSMHCMQCNGVCLQRLCAVSY
jgi:hypothetical protein